MSGFSQNLITEIKYGGMYFDNNSTANSIDTANTEIACQYFTSGTLNGFTYSAGARGEDITSYATNDGGASTLVTTTAAHGLSAGDYITISNTTNYNDVYEVLSAPSTTTFVIDKAWDTNDDGQGAFDRGDCLTVSAGSAGVYDINYNLSSTLAGAGGDTITFTVYVNKTGEVESICQRVFGNNDIGNMGGVSRLTLAEGDKIWLAVKSDGTDDVTNKYGNLIVARV